jgi:2-oxoisovalerate dehydrogenase E1 component
MIQKKYKKSIINGTRRIFMVVMSAETALKMYEIMLRSRKIAETLRKIYYEGKVPRFKLGAGVIYGGLHLPLGQEPTAAGVIIHLSKDDVVIGTHRALHVAVAKGVDIRRLMAEALGKRTGTNKGKGGHMHWFDATSNFWCVPIVGANWPQAVGASLAFKLMGKNNVAVAFGGEGASNQGTFHEALNLAGLWKLPVIFIVEDNNWAISVPKSKSTSVSRISDRSASYGIPGVFVPDNDLFTIFKVAKEAVERARKGLGPTLIAIETYRFGGHFEGDLQIYRSKDEIEEIMNKDPIIKVRRELTQRGWLTEEEYKRIERKVDAEVKNAIEFAKNSAEPLPGEAVQELFVKPHLNATYEPDVGLPQGERKLPMFKAVQEAIAQEMEKDPSVFIMGEDVGKFGGIWSETQGLIEKFGPERVRDTPISESAIVGAAIGASALGMKPIVDLMIIDFIGVAFDQIYNHLAKNHYISGGQIKHSVVLITPVGGGHGDAAHHSQSVYSLLAHAPGLKVVFPSNSYDAKGLLIQAIEDDDPVVYVFHKWTMGLPHIGYPETAVTYVPEEPYTIPLGRARIVREGKDVSVIATGVMVHKALEASKKVEEENNISVEVIDVRCLVPLDKKTLVSSVKKTGKVLIVDEDYLSYGLTGEIYATIVENAFQYLKAPPKRFAVPDVPIPYSRVLEDFVIPSTERIINEIRGLM